LTRIGADSFAGITLYPSLAKKCMEAAVWAGALYYPYMRVRDKDWLKAAALYWDSMCRFQPTGYVLRESLDCRRLIEAGFLSSLNPEPYAADVNRELLMFMRNNVETLQRRFNISNVQAMDNGPGWGTEGPSRGHQGLGWIHISKIIPEFSGFLADEGLAQIGRGDDHQWVGLHPTVAAAYMLALVGACTDRDRLEPVTDNPSPLLSPIRGVVAAIRLLTDGAMDMYGSPDLSYDVAGFAMLAIESVMPRDLAGISVERILDIKDRLGEELGEFRTFVAAQQPELERLASIHSSDISAEAFAVHINSEIKRPLERLERGLKLLGFDTIRSLLTVQTVTPPAALAYVADHAHAPPTVTAVGAVGAVIGSAWWQLARDRKQQIRESPVGYLLSVKRALRARTVVERRAELLARA
jgi:hypothetical protein